MYFRSLTLSTLLAVAALSQQASAQFDQGDNVLGAGIGFGGGYGIGFKGAGVSQSPGIGVHFDHGMGDLGPGVWGLGGYVGYKSIGYESSYSDPFYSYSYDYKWTFFTIGVRGTWHYNEWHGNEKLDTYGGLMLAYNSVSFSNNTVYPDNYGGVRYDYTGGDLVFSGLLGARYYFANNFGAFGELGFGIANFSLGLAYKF